MLGRMFGHEFHALLIFQKFLISDDFAALFGISSQHKCHRGRGLHLKFHPQHSPAFRELLLLHRVVTRGAIRDTSQLVICDLDSTLSP